MYTTRLYDKWFSLQIEACENCFRRLIDYYKKTGCTQYARKCLHECCEDHWMVRSKHTEELHEAIKMLPVY